MDENNEGAWFTISQNINQIGKEKKDFFFSFQGFRKFTLIVFLEKHLRTHVAKEEYKPGRWHSIQKKYKTPSNQSQEGLE